NQRLYSLDALRGFDMLWIMGGAEFIMALHKWLNTGITKTLATQMEHVPWNGFHFYDIIFPLFLFLAGVSFPFSLQKRIQQGQSKRQIIGHIIKRMVILVILGIVYNGFLSFEWPARYASVLGRIGIAYAIASILTLYLNRKTQYIIFGIILISYWAILMLIPIPGVGAGILTPEKSLVAYIDQLLLPGKTYFPHYDPEGILSTIPAIATAQLGIFCGYTLQSNMGDYKKVFQLLLNATALILLGLLWNTVFPINKNIWSSSFVLFAGGLSVFLLAIFYLIIDVWKLKKWAFPFAVIGMNSITIYLAQPILGLYTPHQFFFAGVNKYLPTSIQETFMTFTYILTCWFFLYFLYRKKIFLKV
ncbi:MAG: DUF5009 domain-containing protein, partial [Bacteroidales bacterium]|nr:DUF5009 domain-containing protein [Bacteroidales bacterium]